MENKELTEKDLLVKAFESGFLKGKIEASKASIELLETIKCNTSDQLTKSLCSVAISRIDQWIKENES